MLRLSLRVLQHGLQRPQTAVQQSASVCSVCQALALAQQQQQQDHQKRLHQPVRPSYGQPTRRLQVSTAELQRHGVTPNTRLGREDFDIREHWTYDGPHGVDQWSYYFKACGGSFQSPVDISTLNLVRDSKLSRFNFTNFDTTHDVSWSLDNNGHSAQVTYTSGDLRVSGGGLHSEYNVEQFHFHWGNNDDVGSEHTINGKPYPMEMHVVTYNRNYGSLGNALKYSDGLAVLGVFFEVENMDNAQYQEFVTALQYVQGLGTSYRLQPVPLETLMPKDTARYYRYPGSLTTPPCSEVVTWTLFKQPVGISGQQLDAFRALESLEEEEQTGVRKRLVDNFRPVQLLKGRQVKSSL